jgi:hypothetical protein
MQAVNSDLIMDFLINVSIAGTTALYRYEENITTYLLTKIPQVTDQEAQEFAKKIRLLHCLCCLKRLICS